MGFMAWERTLLSSRLEMVLFRVHLWVCNCRCIVSMMLVPWIAVPCSWLCSRWIHRQLRPSLLRSDRQCVYLPYWLNHWPLLALPRGRLGMFSMFGHGRHRPGNVGQQRDIFWPLWRVAIFKNLLGAAQHFLGWKLYNVTYFFISWTENVCEHSHIFTDQGLIGF